MRVELVRKLEDKLVKDEVQLGFNLVKQELLLENVKRKVPGIVVPEKE